MAAPIINVQPINQQVVIGGTLSLSVDASDATNYQWHQIYEGDSTDVGTDSDSYSKGSFATTDRGYYNVAVMNADGTTLSDDATVTVQPAISVQPVSQAIQYGSPVSLDVTATGLSPITYQWRKDGTSISLATSQAYAIASFGEAYWGIYDVNITCDGNTVTSDDATLLSVPKIITNPLTQSVELYHPVTLTVSATGHLPTYQWNVGGSPITGATSNSYTISSFADGSRGTYTVSVTCDGSDTTSSGAVLSVEPTITVQPVSQSLDMGEDATFSVTAIGHSPITYQWAKNDSTLTGATSSSYSIASVNDADTGSYKVIVYSDGNDVTSSAALLSIQTLSIISISSAVYPNDLINIYGNSFSDVDGTVEFMIDGTWTSTSSIVSWSEEAISCYAPSRNGLFNLRVTTEDASSVISYSGLSVGSTKTSQGGGSDYIGAAGAFRRSFSWKLDAKTLVPVGFSEDWTSV